MTLCYKLQNALRYVDDFDALDSNPCFNIFPFNNLYTVFPPTTLNRTLLTNLDSDIAASSLLKDKEMFARIFEHTQWLLLH